MHIETDTYIDLNLDEDGDPIISSAIYIVDQDEPVLNDSISFVSMIDKWIEDNSIPTNPRSMRPEYKDDARAPLIKMVNILQQKLLDIDDIEIWVPKEQ